MCSLFDYGLVSPVALYETVQLLHEMVKDHHAKAMQGSWEAQKEYWIKSGAKEKQNTPSHFKNQPPSGINVDPSARRKLYSPGSYKSESPSRRKTQQQDDEDEEDEDEDEDYEDEDEDDENDKVDNQKSSCSSSSASSTSSDFVTLKKKSVSSSSDPDKRKLASANSISVSSSINNQQKGQVIVGKTQTNHGQKPSSNLNLKSQSAESSSGDSLKRKSSSRGPSPSPGLKPIPSQNNSKSLSGVSNEPPVKKKIVTQQNGKPQAVSSQLGADSSELKRKAITSIGSTMSPTVPGLSQQMGSKGPQGVNDLKKRLSLPPMPTNGACSAVQNFELKKKPISNGVSILTDGKLISNCTVEMSPIVEEIVSVNSNKVPTSDLNDVKRRSSLGPNSIGFLSGQEENILQRRKSLCTDSPATQDSSLVLLNRKSFSSNQSSESSPIQTVPSKGVTS